MPELSNAVTVNSLGTLAVAIKHHVSPAWVRRLKQRRRETGEIAARPPKKKTPAKWRAYAARMETILAERPDITLHELRAELGVDFSVQTLSVALRTLKYTFKKKSCARRSRIDRMSRIISVWPARECTARGPASAARGAWVLSRCPRPPEVPRRRRPRAGRRPSPRCRAAFRLPVRRRPCRRHWRCHRRRAR